ncbi:hypothetical protein GTY82_32895 [Streptomyces sp. SID5476]|uniref:Uncharacterized protein n=1 Tax=Streptomyces bottropensis ATCC 25435 TaxID=1054862 RepID=M3D9D2_9ACTN|nr:hypothetical protein SBD_5958 [Streptomyces bottropensis ATCC 25435]MZD21945.1 hypothetical protein [Streptomyces sp. SID5476]
MTRFRTTGKASALRSTGVSTDVAGTPWRSLTLVQVHAGSGITTAEGPRDADASGQRLDRCAGRPEPR